MSTGALVAGTEIAGGIVAKSGRSGVLFRVTLPGTLGAMRRNQDPVAGERIQAAMRSGGEVLGKHEQLLINCRGTIHHRSESRTRESSLRDLGGIPLFPALSAWLDMERPLRGLKPSSGGLKGSFGTGAENGFDMHVKCLEIAADFGQASEGADRAVEIGGANLVYADGQFEVVLDQFWDLVLPAKGSAEHSEQANQGTAAAYLTHIVRAVTDGFTIDAKNGVLQGNDAPLLLKLPTGGAHGQNL